MKLKKFFALALAAATLALALTACGSKADDSADNSDANTDNQAGETVTVKLGVVGGIYDDLWAPAKAALADEGIGPGDVVAVRGSGGVGQMAARAAMLDLAVLESLAGRLEAEQATTVFAQIEMPLVPVVR